MLRSGRTIAMTGLLSTMLACSGADLMAPGNAFVDDNNTASTALADDGRAERARRVAEANTLTARERLTEAEELSGANVRTVEPIGRFNLTPRLFGNASSSLNCLSEGTQFGAWQVRYHGHGCVGLQSVNGLTTLYMAPTSALNGAVTHAPLAVGPEHGDRVTLRANFETIEHTRLFGAPNPWEVAWLVWHFQDDEHFYYFIPKPNGWELGKRDPAYPGGQRFLATGTERLFPIGQVYEVTVQQRGTLMTVFVDGEQVVQFRDGERPYRSGRVALYSEDAAIRVHDVASL